MDAIIEKAFLHNKFGCYCLKSGQLEKAEKHFFLALDQLEDKTVFSNIYQNLGNVYAQKKNHPLAIEYYEKIIEYSPFNTKTKINNSSLEILAKQEPPLLQKPSEKEEKLIKNLSKLAFNFEIKTNPKFNSFDAYVDAHVNIAVMHLSLDNFEKALEYCQKAVELNPENFEAAINFGDILRQVTIILKNMLIPLLGWP